MRIGRLQIGLMIVIHRTMQARECSDRALVLVAMGIDHEVRRGMLGWHILVPEERRADALEQWRLYERENRPRAKPAAQFDARPGAVAGVLAWASILVLFYALEVRLGFGIDWLARGSVAVAEIRAGEWWRVVTGLTLHADAAHLLVNIGFGGFFGTLLAREIGGGLAWLLILAGGAAGNFLNVIVQRPSHSAIGASTAVFAALGILAAYLWTGRRLIRDTWARRLAPVVGAIILLAWLGTGNENTDIVAHLTGFIAGFSTGAVLGRLHRPGPADPGRQSLCGAAAVLLILLSWTAATS